MSWYYSSVIIWDSPLETDIRAALIRAARLARKTEGLKRRSLIQCWTKPIAKAYRNREYIDEAIAIPCHGNYAINEMRALAEATAHLSAQSEKPFAGNCITMVWRDKGTDRHTPPNIEHFQETLK